MYLVHSSSRVSALPSTYVLHVRLRVSCILMATILISSAQSKLILHLYSVLRLLELVELVLVYLVLNLI
jgi:hypothetical protein